MHRFLLCCALLLTACTRPPEPVVNVTPDISPDLTKGCDGYTGPSPENEGQLSDAHIAEYRGRLCANAKLETIEETINRAKNTKDNT